MNFISMKTPHSMTRNNGPQWQHGTLIHYLRLQVNSVANKETIFDLYLNDPWALVYFMNVKFRVPLKTF